jgi:two-component system, sensor histidine kinase and response regulator
MRELISEKRRWIGGRGLRFLSIYGPFVLIIALSFSVFLYMGFTPDVDQITAIIALLSGTLVLSGIISWRYASNLYGKEKQIRSNEILREAFIGKTRSALSVKDLDGHYLYSNEVWGKMVGLPEKDIEGKTDFDLFPIMQATILRQQDDEILQGGDRVEFDDILTAADGVSKFTVMKFAMRTRSGRIYGVGSIAHDITNVLSTETALKDSEHRFEALLDMAPNAIIIANEEGAIQLVNRQAENLFGRNSEALTQLNMGELIPEESWQQLRDERIEFLKSPSTRVFGADREMFGLRGNGSTFPIEVAMSPVESGDESMIMCIVRDITKQVQAMSALEESTTQLQLLNRELEEERQSLEQRVNRRTEELNLARQRAEEANKAKSSFLATMSHEIRTPMNGVIGTIDVLRQSSLKPRQLDQVEIIKDSAYSLLTVIDDILDFSKIEAGKIELESEPVVISYLTESICNAMLSIAGKKQVGLRFYLDPHLPGAIISDAVRLRQIVINLVGNALKFSGSTTRMGHVDARFEKQGENLQIRVIDNGIGMSAAAIATVFEPFTQADTSTTRRFGGTGLGLPITKRIVEMLGGSLQIDSEEGEGSTFTVTIPIEEVARAGVEEQEPQLQNAQCRLLCPRLAENKDWQTYLRYEGAELEVVETLEQLLAKPANGKVVAVAVENDEEIATYKRLLDSSRESFQRLVIVRPLLHHRVEVLDDETTLVNLNPSTGVCFHDVLAAISGNVEHLEDAESEEKETRKQITREEAEKLGRMILVAEDNDINQKVIKNQLDLLGYAYDVAGNGQEALELWSERHYSLLLTDLHMPIIDGYELTAAIRRQETAGQQQLPIVAFTANATKGERQLCIEAGMNDYLPKPVPLESLQSKLEKWACKILEEAPLPGINKQDDEDPELVEERESQLTRETSSESSENANGSTELSTLDVNVLVQLVGDDDALIASFLSEYKQSAENAAAQIEEAYKGGQWKRVADLAHGLKSSSRSVGALALGEICAELESAGKNDDESQIHSAMSGFTQSLHAVMESIGQRDS